MQDQGQGSNVNVHVNGMSLCLLTATSNGPIVDEYVAAVELY
jgi:hypothetical protein